VTSRHAPELIVLRAGDAAAPVAEVHGQFFGFIKARVGAAWKHEWREHDVRGDAEMPSLARAAGLIVTGSSSSVTEQAPWMKRTGAFLKRAIDDGIPIFGICFGHQLVADALGGRVEKNPRGREIGTVRLRLHDHARDEALFAECPAEMDVHATHVDTVTDLPKGATRLAVTDLEPNAAYAIGDRVRCVQFHPEFDAEITRGYVRARAHLIDGEGLSSSRIHDAVKDAPFAAKILVNFVERHVNR
jgi:GMP synthase (glutamine-hydrolysing)